MPRGHRCDLSGVRREAFITGRERAVEECNGPADVRKVAQELVAGEAVFLVDNIVVRGNSVRYELSVGVEKWKGAVGECVV